MYTCAVLTVSDSCAQGQREDLSGKLVMSLIKPLPANIVQYDVVPDNQEMIESRLVTYCDRLQVDLVLTTGGTGFGPRDRTPEATREVIERDVPGIPETMRSAGREFSERAILSRGIAGIRGRTLMVNLPGSPKGAEQSLTAVLDVLAHGLDMLAGKAHTQEKSPKD